jgi:Bifunctional DNA primase/polymerase, N-terminal/AAA domain/Primase C terminal 2 (PriCT-2)
MSTKVESPAGVGSGEGSKSSSEGVLNGFEQTKANGQGQAPSCVEAALGYAARDWTIFPAPQGEKKSHKSAEYSGGVNWGATKDPAQIKRDWRRWPDANIGIPTGAENGFFVVEADTVKGHGKDGIASLKDLEAKHTKLPNTLMAESPSGSIHYYFNHPRNGIKIKNSTSEIAPGVDVRGDGGMVVAPPSIRQDGAYRWLIIRPIADAPQWLRDLVKEDRRAATEPNAFLKHANQQDAPPAWKVEAALKVLVPNEIDRDTRGAIGIAIKNSMGEDGWPLFDAWLKTRTDGKYYEDRVRKNWDGFKPRGEVNIGTLFYLAEKASPDWLERARPAEPQKTAFTITAAPYAFPAETSIPQYDWLLGRHLLRGEVAGSAATGGTGKSSLSIVEALAMASGRQLTHDAVPNKPLRVVLINLEDKPSTMHKRIAAAMRHHELTKEDIGDRLIVLAKGEVKFKIARQLRTGAVERGEEVISALTQLMTDNKADVLSIDSFIRTHSVNENDNSAVEDVVECFEDIAKAADCAVHLWHHNRKSGGLGASVESARGAQAFIDACRSVRILETMTSEEARKLKIVNRRCHLLSFNGKLNFALATDQSDWFVITSVRINNGPALQGMHLLGDDVGVVETWQHPGTVEADLSPANVEAIKQAVSSREWREDARAAMWVGKAIAQVLRLDPEDDAGMIKATIKRLIEMGALKREPGRDENRKARVFVVPCASSAPKSNNTPTSQSKMEKEPLLYVPRIPEYKTVGPAPGELCDYCGKDTGNVLLMYDPFREVKGRPLHEECAPKFYKRNRVDS